MEKRTALPNECQFSPKDLIFRSEAYHGRRSMNEQMFDGLSFRENEYLTQLVEV
jgi:hypothetical protein